MINPAEGKIWPDFERLEEILKEWGRTDSRRVHVCVEGYSPRNRPVYSVAMTDPDAPPEEKQHTVLSAVHTGGERSSAATLFAVMRWLLSDDELAKEVLRRQVVVCMPVVHPDGYVEGRLAPGQLPRHHHLYYGWDMGGVTNAELAPEAVALQRVLDRYRPDMYADVHGISLDFKQQLMLESSASSPTRLTSRPYHQQIARMMDQAALEGGFPSDFQEDDRELLYWGPSIDTLANKLWGGRDRWSPGLYAYAKYHTLHVLMEIAWQQSGLLRFQRLLQIGNERWEGENDPGYPNRVVGVSGNYQMIVAYGDKPAQKRESRTELWSRYHQFSSATVDPNTAGKTVAVFTLSPQSRARWIDGNDTAAAFAENLKQHPGMNGAYIQDFLRGWPVGQNRSEAFFRMKDGRDASKPAQDESEPIQHGIAFRLRLPFLKAQIQEIRLNGHPLTESAEDGYTVWKARGLTFVQVNVPPSKSRSETLFVVTCKYDPGEVRTLWEL